MVGIGHWAQRSNQKGLVGYVFEEGARGRRYVERMFSVLYKPPPELPPSPYDWQKVLRISEWSFLPKDGAMSYSPQTGSPMKSINTWTIVSLRG